jgi:hypothetical protein
MVPEADKYRPIFADIVQGEDHVGESTRWVNAARLIMIEHPPRPDWHAMSWLERAPRSGTVHRQDERSHCNRATKVAKGLDELELLSGLFLYLFRRNGDEEKLRCHDPERAMKV